jgi:hypothetical protein
LNARLRAGLTTLALCACAAVGLAAYAADLRADREAVAIDRFRAHPFGAGRHTRFDASFRSLTRARGAIRFEAEAPAWVFGPCRVGVRFGDAAPVEFAVDDAEVTPLDPAATELAAALRDAPPPGRARPGTPPGE